MRHVFLAIVGSSLVLSGCGKKEATGNTSALDQTVTAEDFATSDATAIDAATGAAANMAADVDFNAFENEDGDGGNRATTDSSRRRPRDRTAADGSNSAAPAPPAPATETPGPAQPAETNVN